MKTGIVFEGGAYRTVFSCGVIDALIKENIYPDYMIGVSAGAGYGVSYASRQYKRNIKILMKHCDDERYLSFKNFFKKDNRSIFGLDFVYNTIPNKMIKFDYDTYDKFEGGFLCGMTNALTGKAEYKPYLSDDKDMHILRATCAIPLLFPLIYLDGIPYLDGGITDPIPFNKAFNDGCERIIVVSTKEAGYRKKPKKMLQILLNLYSDYPKLQDALLSFYDVYNEQMILLEKYQDDGRLFVIRPKTTKGTKLMERDRTKLLSLYNDGFNQTLEKMPLIHDFWGR